MFLFLVKSSLEDFVRLVFDFEDFIWAFLRVLMGFDLDFSLRSQELKI